MDESVRQYYDLINQQQQQNNAWSAEQAQKAMDYQTQMSNTAHQREVADLKAAGLNPVLSAGSQGATTGTGHAAQAGDANVTALYGLLSKAMEAQYAQAEAMKTSAKAVSGATGSYKPFDADKPDESVEEIVSDLENGGLPGIGTLNGFFELLENLGFPIDLIEGIARKVLHLSKSDLEMLKKHFGDEPLHTIPMIPKKNNKNGNGKGGSSSPMLHTYEAGYGAKEMVRDGKPDNAEKKTPAQEKGRTTTKKQKQEAAAAVGLALAAIIGKGLSGGSSKRIKALASAEMDKY